MRIRHYIAVTTTIFHFHLIDSTKSIPCRHILINPITETNHSTTSGPWWCPSTAVSSRYVKWLKYVSNDTHVFNNFTSSLLEVQLWWYFVSPFMSVLCDELPDTTFGILWTYKRPAASIYCLLKLMVHALAVFEGEQSSQNDFKWVLDFVW